MVSYIGYYEIGLYRYNILRKYYWLIIFILYECYKFVEVYIVEWGKVLKSNFFRIII